MPLSMRVVLRCKELRNVIDNDIKYAENIFLKNGQVFDEEKRAILLCNESADIYACPGSGKTTVLLSKLSVLEKQLPYDKNMGICVLTHTNVAINEVKERLGNRSLKLFEYPNYFGTIQSFVDKFLAIPFYDSIYKRKLQCIDNEVYNREIVKEYYKINKKLRDGLALKFKGQDVLEKVRNIRFDFNGNNLVLGIMGTELYKTENATLAALRRMKYNLLSQGVLCYDDAYFMAYKYICKNKFQLKNLFSERFKFIFIDEMQDTGKHQELILKQIFDRGKSIVQTFGDPNQAIYEGNSQNDLNVSEAAVTTPVKTLRITNSKRFSNAISKVIAPFELIKTNMNGNEDIYDIQPKIIIFNDQNINNVIERFGQIIVDNKLHQLDNKIFKAVGWIGKENSSGKVTISSYFNTYKKDVVNRKRFKNIRSYLVKGNIEKSNSKDVINYHEFLIRAMLEVLYQADVKDDMGKFYTIKSFYEKVKLDNDLFNELRINLANWTLEIKNDTCIFLSFKEYVYKLLEQCFNIDKQNEVVKNLLDNLDEAEEQEVFSSNGNKYTCNIDNNVFDIELDTIHSVKGQTHTATLYLETFYRTMDIKRLRKYFIGSNEKNTNSLLIENLKVAYVAMSRPTHLLCVAASNQSIEGYEEKFQNMGWELIYL